MFTADDIISSYSRAQAIEDGVLVDVSDTAKEAGFKYPVAVTTAVWDDCVMKKSRSAGDPEGRLWDILTMMKYAAKNGGEQINFTVLISRRRVALKALCHGGDNREPVITIMLPNES